MSEVILDTLIDSIKLVPFLFLTYLAMEYLEHKAGEKTTHMVRKAGKMGPLIGGVAGVLPQCGFSAAASNLYAGRVITLGTLIAIYLSTSDEMLPILISEKMDIRFVLGVLGAKAAIGAVAGFVIDLLVRERKMHPMTMFTGMRKMIMKRKSTFMKSVSMRTAIVKRMAFFYLR